MKNKTKKYFWICATIVLFMVLLGIAYIIMDNEIKRYEPEESSEYQLESGNEYFLANYSVYRNPIDQYFWTKIYSWDASQKEIGEAQKEYKKAWKTEYQNVMAWLNKKCVYDVDKENLRLLEKSVADRIEIEQEVIKTELTSAYEINPDPSQAKNNITRISLQGYGTQERLDQSEGEIYRDVCMRILNLYGHGEEYEFKFRETNK